MKVLFFSFYYKFSIEVHPGIAVLSAALKNRGHETRLQPYFYLDKNTFAKTIEEYKPDMIGISATHMAVSQVERLVDFLKQISAVPITLGGVFPILEPDRALGIEGIDAICIGEGVDGIIDYVEGRHPAPNYVYQDGRRGTRRSWSSLPIYKFDYDIFFDAMPQGYTHKKIDYWTCFTCEYGCSFCSSKNFRKKVGLTNKPRQEQEFAIKQIEELVEKTGCKKIHFRDPLFLGKKERKWVEGFLNFYKERLHIKYTCNLRADSIDEDMIRLLKDSGCYTIKMGLESGDEYIRNHILKKGEKDLDYKRACSMIHDSGIRLSLNAMIGLPYETVETAQKTMDMLLNLGSEKTFLHIFQPWPGLSLDEKIKNAIIYIKSPALYDVKVQGRMSDDFMNGILFDEDFALAETVEFPVLDQLQFPYTMAVHMQKEFQKRLVV